MWTCSLKKSVVPKKDFGLLSFVLCHLTMKKEFFDIVFVLLLKGWFKA